MTFVVFTTDGRSTEFQGDAADFIVRWKTALVQPEGEWPYAYTQDEQRQVEVIHFNPAQITAVAVAMRQEER